MKLKELDMQDAIHTLQKCSYLCLKVECDVFIGYICLELNLRLHKLMSIL